MYCLASTVLYIYKGNLQSMTTSAQPTNYWIQNPRFDLVYLSYGWIVVLAAFMVFKQYYGALILMVLAFNFVHRHYTFALVYGQREEFDKRRWSYILLPVGFLVLTAVSIVFNFFTILLAVYVI